MPLLALQHGTYSSRKSPKFSALPDNVHFFQTAIALPSSKDFESNQRASGESPSRPAIIETTF
ncbi:MAG: hypothetical protein M3458_13330 [Acidobacteriota bacterium]|nr:hypothetical protein [Acidobacteriota bacterium]